VGNKKLSLALDSRLLELEQLSDAIGTFCAGAGASADAPDFILCAEELFTNVVLHGLSGEAGHRIDVEIALDAGELKVSIIDSAPAFDPTILTAPDLSASVEDRPIGGLGRYFVSTTMNFFCYRREQGRNHVSFGRAI
jgi:serine/threonine-protein kinase RsbW